MRQKNFRLLVLLFFCFMVITGYQNNVNAAESLSKNKIQFDLDLKNGTVLVKAEYVKSDLLGKEFLLNRDFTVKKIVYDGKEINPEKIKKQITYDEGYLVNLYQLPSFEKTLKIQYTGFLSGKTGFSPYVKEKISEDFTFLRWETFCYPIFANAFESTLTFLDAPLQSEITVNVPKEYTAVSPFQLKKETKKGDKVSFVYDGNIADFSCAIAKYHILQLPSGEFYFLENMDFNKLSDFVTPIMNTAQNYMNEHFGKADISTSMKYITIPSRFGSFAPKNCIYVEEGAFESTFEMRQLIHEFIHLGWNPKTEREIQRSRFFDEGFTTYFTARVLGELLGEETYLSEIERGKEKYIKMVQEDKDKFVPIAEYGEYEYGDLSYQIGPVFLDELCKLVGQKTFDKATKEFLKKYKNTSVDFETMQKEYTRLCKNDEVEQLFQNWIFTTNGYAQWIK